MIGHTREQPAQLDDGRQFTVLIERGADCGGFGFGDGEHGDNLEVCAAAGKRGPTFTPEGLREKVAAPKSAAKFREETSKKQRANAPQNKLATLPESWQGVFVRCIKSVVKADQGQQLPGLATAP